MPLLTIEISGDRPPRYGCGARLPFTVGRGPVPRQRSIAPTLAGDRPPRYGQIETRRSLLPGETEPLGVSRNPFDNNEL